MTNDRNIEYSGGDEDFCTWLDEVDILCGHVVGLSIHDLRDNLWRDAYDAGDSPKEAWEDAIANGILEL